MSNFYESQQPSDSSLGRPWSKILIFAVIGILVLAGAALGGNYILHQTIFDTPERAAESWLEEFIEGDTERILDLTCNEQLWIANARAATKSLAAIIDVVPILELIELSDYVTGVDIDKLLALADVSFDLSHLDFTGPEQPGNAAIVRVEGQLRIKALGDEWYGIAVDERWRVVQEGGDWNWCGRVP